MLPRHAGFSLFAKNVSLAEWFNPSKGSANNEDEEPRGEGEVHAGIQTRSRDDDQCIELLALQRKVCATGHVPSQLATLMQVGVITMVKKLSNARE